MNSPDILELNEEYISMEYSDDTIKTKTSTNSVIELGKTLLSAAREGDTMTVIDLMSKGAPFTTDWLGTSPLHLAAMNNHIDTCETLIRAGIGKDSKTKVDRSALHFAAYEGHADIVELLIKHNADIDCKDMLHMSPLHWAVERQHGDCATLLIKSGADPTSLSRFQKTPLSIAMELEWDSMVNKLETAQVERNKESISHTLQAVEGITESICLQQDDDLMQGDGAGSHDDDGKSGDDDMEMEIPRNHIENILPKITTHNNNEATLQLLREHGIVMLPNDNSNTITSALQSGRKIVLSDAGKLLLKDMKDPGKGTFDVKKKQILIPPAKSKTAKIYTMTGSQFLAMTGQNKSSNIMTKLPINITKAFNNSSNNKVKTLPVLKAINLNQSPTKLPPGAKLINPGKVITLNSLNKMSRNLSEELSNVKALASQGKTKVIQLKNASNMGKPVKIVVKNTSGNKVNALTTFTKLTTALEQKGSFSLSHPSKDDYETLKNMLLETKQELEEYKTKYKLLQEEHDALKNRIGETFEVSEVNSITWESEMTHTDSIENAVELESQDVDLPVIQ